LALAKPSIGSTFDYWVPDNDNLENHRRGSIRKLRPVLLERTPLVHYVWQVDPTDQPPLQALDDLTSTLGSFGWAVDQAYAVVSLLRAEQIDATLLARDPVDRFRPVRRTASLNGSLRVPTPGSMRDLEQVHAANRAAVENQAERRRKRWPRVFDRVLYTNPERAIGKPYAVFKLLDASEDRVRYPHAKLIHVAGMTRHLAIYRMSRVPPGWVDPAEWVNRVVRGKRDESCQDEHRQFSYVPLPSIGHEHSDAMIRNVMIVAPLGMDRELAYLAEKLNGELLIPEVRADSCAATQAQPIASGSIELERFNPPAGKFIERHYLATADIWHTVTPVILPGHNDHKPEKTVKLIQRALEQSGIETPCEFAWQSIPFLKHCLSAHKYDSQGKPTGYFRPTYLNGNTMVHLRLRFGRRKLDGDAESEWLPANVTGPIVVGAGRHCGFGLMAAEGS
jgi:CRISPR-associated protein Csb2